MASDTLGPEEPIELAEVKKAKKSQKGMTLETAQEVVKAALPAIDGGETAPAFTDEFLEAAAVLKVKALPAYQQLAGELKPLSHVNMHDWKRAVNQAAKAVTTRIRRRGDARPVILDTADLHEVVDVCVEILGAAGTMFQREGELVQIIEDQRGAQLRSVPVDGLRDQMSRLARFERATDEGNKPLKPPVDVMRALHSRGQWDGIDRLRGFVDGACILADGTILNTDGYHPDAELFVRRGCTVNVPRTPTKAQAEAAYERLLDLFCDFEFEADEQDAHRAVPIAALLTILARNAIDGCVPLILMDASRTRLGKTLLCNLVCRIATGEPATPRAFPSGRDGDTEVSKQITSIARSGRPIVFFDNVKGTLGGQALELAITSRRVSGRALGSNDSSADVDAELAVTWLATSNNASLTPDMEGRSLVARLVSDREHPEQREDLQIPNITRHVADHRSEYLSAALTILRAWVVADDKPALTAWGSFQEWSHMVRGAIVHAGGSDPFRARQSLKYADSETRLLRTVLAAWPSGVELKAAELARALKGADPIRDAHGATCHDLVDSLEELVNTTSARGIGKKLGIYRDRVIGGRRLIGREDRKGVYRWSVEVLEDAEIASQVV